VEAAFRGEEAGMSDEIAKAVNLLDSFRNIVIDRKLRMKRRLPLTKPPRWSPDADSLLPKDLNTTDDWDTQCLELPEVLVLTLELFLYYNAIPPCFERYL